MVKLYRYWRKGYYGLLGKWGIIKWIQDISRRKKWQGTVFVVVWLGSIPTKTVSLGLGSLLLLLSCLLPNHRRCTFTRRKRSLWEVSPAFFKLFLIPVHTPSSFLSTMRWQIYLSCILTIVSLLQQHMSPSKQTLTSWKLIVLQTLPPSLSHLSLLSFPPHALLRSLSFSLFLKLLLLFWILQQLINHIDLKASKSYQILQYLEHKSSKIFCALI